jgi:cation diffusion facilitator family transporter
MKNHSTKVSQSQRSFLPMLSLIIGFGLLCIKFYAYHLTGSQSIFSDALESIVNVVAGIITIAVIIQAAKPADEDHPYGHGKLESMAATFEGGAITLAGILIVIQAFQVFFHGSKIEEIQLGVLLTLFAGLVNGILGLYLKKRGEKIHSEALKSSGAHLLGDAYTSIGVLLSLIVVKLTGQVWVDPVIAAIFGFVLCYTGGKILIRSGNVLMDAHDLEVLQSIADMFEKNYVTGVITIHHTRVIRSGAFHHIDCHVVVPEFWSVHEAHLFSEKFEENFVKTYSTDAELRIHLDPCRRVYCENCDIEKCSIRVKEFIARIPINNLKEMLSLEESR